MGAGNEKRVPEPLLPSITMPVRFVSVVHVHDQVEVAVTKAIHGERSNNLSALANPDCLGDFEKAGRVLRGLAGTGAGTSRL